MLNTSLPIAFYVQNYIQKLPLNYTEEVKDILNTTP